MISHTTYDVNLYINAHTIIEKYATVIQRKNMRRALIISRDFINIISQIEMAPLSGDVNRGSIVISPGGSCHYISIFAENINMSVEYLIISSRTALFSVVSEELKRLHVRFTILPSRGGSTSLLNYVYSSGGHLERVIEQNTEIAIDGPNIKDYIGDNIAKFNLVIADSSIPVNSMKSVTDMCEEHGKPLWIVNTLAGADKMSGQLKCDANFTRQVTVPTSLSNKNCVFIYEKDMITTAILHNGPKSTIPMPALAKANRLFRFMGGRDLFILYMADTLLDKMEIDGNKNSLMSYMNESVIKKSMERAIANFTELCRSKSINSSTTLESVIDILENNAYIDSLTKVYNRHYVSKVFSEWTEYSVLFIDADNFKRINDDLGHDKGDEALKIIADTIRRHLRSEDIIMRWGGEEFVCVLPESDKKAAVYAASRILEGLRNSGFDYKLTASIGVTDSSSGDMDKCITAADKLMYEAKTTGKNRVVS